MPGPGGKSNAAAVPRLRLDKWLWQARFFKTRADAAEAITSGHVRLNGTKMKKPGHGVTEQDVLTFLQADRVRLIRIAALGLRRGPFSEAQSLYVDLDAPASPLE